jgi:hypothetical protein
MILFVLSNFFVFSAAAMISDLVFPKRGRWFRFLALLCLAVVEVIWLELATGLAGCLTVSAVTVVAGAALMLTGVVWLAVNRRQLPQRLFSKWLLLVPVILIAGIPLGWFAGRYVFQGTHFCEDDLSYHATAAAHWYLEKSIAAGPLNYHYHVPLNAQLFSLWFLLPFGEDGLVFLSGLFWMALSCTAAIVLMQNMGIERKWFGLTIFSFFCCQVVLHQATWTFTAVDLAGPAMVLSAVAFLSSIPELFPARRWPYILLAGLCAGVAFGTKVPFMTVFGVLVIWVFWTVKDWFSNRLGNVLLFVLAAAATGTYWYIRNLILVGNPVFPGEMGPFKGPLTSEIQFNTSLVGQIVNSGFDVSLILEILRRHLAWPLGVFILSAAGYAAGFISLFRRGEHRKTVGLLLLVAMVMLVTYPTMPFSGQNNSLNTPLSIALRFVIGPFVVGLILLSLLLNNKSSLRWGWYCFYGAGLILAMYACPNPIQIVIGAAALLWFILFSWKPKGFLDLPVHWMISLLLLLPGGLWGLVMNKPILQEKTNRRLYQNNVYMGINLYDAWHRIESLPSGSRIAVFGAFAHTYYPLFGRHFQLQPWPLSIDAAHYEPLYIQWKVNPESLYWWGPAKVIDAKKWTQQLVRSGAEYVLVQWVNEDARPQPYEILQRFESAEKIDSGGNWGLWKIKQ